MSNIVCQRTQILPMIDIANKSLASGASILSRYRLPSLCGCRLHTRCIKPYHVDSAERPDTTCTTENCACFGNGAHRTAVHIKELRERFQGPLERQIQRPSATSHGAYASTGQSLLTSVSKLTESENRVSLPPDMKNHSLEFHLTHWAPPYHSLSVAL
jgi:hypothetical protein